ncbi:Protein-lysine N-methyltransferase EFM5 [Yarrowia sp. C11]|nr:Protein-lysine N-methyltransferase EFM5 [Yarrowia sp. E02]KAG5365351.1 Protein-lysine N-methyltransferase EFM5 [Yarrowia sp. C11]
MAPDVAAFIENDLHNEIDASLGFEDEPLQLSASTLAALMDFQNEQEEREQKFAELHKQAEEDFDKLCDGSKDIQDFEEDWQLSQFWYNNATATKLARELLEGADKDTVIAIVSAPSVYAAMKALPEEEIVTQNVFLLEYDERFGVLAGKKRFVHYDFNKPLLLPNEIKNVCDRVLVDPPFLSEECQTKAAMTARLLLKKPTSRNDKYKTIVCTGERMAGVIAKVYPDTKVTDFHPEHEKGLSNEFRCYATYEGAGWKFV